MVNTPTPRSGAVRDAAEIRLAATAEGILCLTAMETAVAAAEALDPGDRRPAGRRPLARRMDAESDPRDGRDLIAVRPASAVTTIAWPSDHSVSVVRPTMTTASGICRRRSAAVDIPAGASATATTCPPHAPSMCPPTTAASWIVQTRPGGSQSPLGVWKAVPNRFRPALERVGDGDEDALAVDQQVGQVVGDQVADGDRQQPGADRAEADRPRHREREQRRRCP